MNKGFTNVLTNVRKDTSYNMLISIFHGIMFYYYKGESMMKRLTKNETKL